MNRTRPIGELWMELAQKLRGHSAYYGVSDNSPWLQRFRYAVLWLLYRWLNRRSQRRSFSVASFYRYIDRYPLVTPSRLVNLNSAFV